MARAEVVAGTSAPTREPPVQTPWWTTAEPWGETHASNHRLRLPLSVCLQAGIREGKLPNPVRHVQGNVGASVLLPGPDEASPRHGATSARAIARGGGAVPCAGRHAAADPPGLRSRRDERWRLAPFRGFLGLRQRLRPGGSRPRSLRRSRGGAGDHQRGLQRGPAGCLGPNPRRRTGGAGRRRG